jgi:ADP-heptose:LPS heptosyltransferase
VKRLAIWPEQGVGDQVLFSTLLPDLASRGVQAVVELDPRLLTIYRRSLPAFTFVAPAAADAAFGSCDAQLALGSLPRLLRPTAESFSKQPRALLVPDEARVARARERLGPGRWIAISWRSLQRGDRKALGERKSIPLEHFAALAQCAGARLLDLQYGDVAAERTAFHARHPGMLLRLEDLDTDNDFEGIVAAMAACERVVTSSNVTAHFAGAIGKETSLLFLDGWPPFHYWTAGPDRRSLWYPSVQIASDASWIDWERAFAAVCKGLQDRC